MRDKIKKVISKLPIGIRKHLEMVFSDSAENHLFLLRLGQKKFRSYTELKRHQKRVRAFVSVMILAIISLLVGIVVGPALFPTPQEPEIYIPNGKGDIVLGNISKNQFTIIFKTLDSANGNKPLATKATVEVYEDAKYTNLERRTNEDDYAVTHIIPVDSLQEGKTYYIKILASDSAVPANTKVVSNLGGGSDPIEVFTAGDLIADCKQLSGEKNVSGKDNQNTTNSGSSFEFVNKNSSNSSLSISDVQNENHLQPDNKVQTIISWLTNMPSTTVITYGEQGSDERKEITSSEQLSTKHAVVMTTLKTGTAYYFTATSKDASGNIVTSEEYSLRTPRAEKNVVEKIKENYDQLIEQVIP